MLVPYLQRDIYVPCRPNLVETEYYNMNYISGIVESVQFPKHVPFFSFFINVTNFVIVLIYTVLQIKKCVLREVSARLNTSMTCSQVQSRPFLY
jgi:hypothetical protein